MERAGLAPATIRGGGAITPPRPTDPRVASNAAAIVLAAAAAGFPLALGGAYTLAIASLAAASFIAAVGATALRAARAVGWSLALVLTEDVVAIVGGAGGALTALLMAALLFLQAEFSFAAVEAQSRMHYERTAIGGWATTRLLALAGALTVDALLLLGANRAPEPGQALTVLGAAAAVAALAVLVAIARVRWDPPPDSPRETTLRTPHAPEKQETPP